MLVNCSSINLIKIAKEREQERLALYLTIEKLKEKFNLTDQECEEILEESKREIDTVYQANRNSSCFIF